MDLTGDETIDNNDRKAIGYSTTAPDLYYNFHLGAEYKGLGIDAMFQGVGKWTGFKTTNGLYRSAVASNTLVAVSLRELLVCRARQYRECQSSHVSQQQAMPTTI